MKYETAQEIELAIVHWFDARRCLIIPNLSYGLLAYECDLAILTDSNYLYEVEIKTSHGDLVRDKQKHKWKYYNGYRMRRLWFAIPTKLLGSIEHVPEFAGILLVNQYGQASEIRKPVTDYRVRKLTDKERYKFARLGALRIWSLKRKLLHHHIK